MSESPPSSQVYQSFPSQTGTSPPVTFPASQDSILSPPLPSNSEAIQEAATMLTHQVPARQESRDQEECDNNTAREEEDGETDQNEQGGEGDEGENQLGGAPFSPLATQHGGNPPQQFVFGPNWNHRHSGRPHLPQRAEASLRAYPGSVEFDGDEVDGLEDAVDDNDEVSDDKYEAANEDKMKSHDEQVSSAPASVKELDDCNNDSSRVPREID